MKLELQSNRDVPLVLLYRYSNDSFQAKVKSMRWAIGAWI